MLKSILGSQVARTLCAATVLAWAAAGPASAQLATDAMTTSSIPVTTSDLGLPNSINFTGNAVLKSRYVPDPDFGKPSMLLEFDVNGLVAKGQGANAKKTYLVRGGQELLVRPHGPNHTVEFLFTVVGSDADPLTASRIGKATFNINVDTTANRVSNATGSISNAQ